MRAVLPVVVLAACLAAACAEITDPVRQRPDLTGEWLFTQLAVFGPEDECRATGVMNLIQSGDAVQGAATLAGVSWCGLPDGPLSGVQLTDTSIAFSIGSCIYAATFGASPDSLTGTLACPAFPVLLQPATWSAVRLGAAASLTLDLVVPRTMVPGGTTQLIATLRDAAGHPLYFRTLDWATDNGTTLSLTAADYSAVVGALAPGTGTVTVSLGALSAAAVFMVQQVSFRTVAAGAQHSCGLDASGALWCWGSSYIADPSGFASATPVRTPVGTFGSLTAGVTGGCGLDAAGVALCWGYVYADSLRTYYATPTVMAQGRPFAAVTLGSDHMCGLTAEGLAYCWGSNVWGQLGRTTPGHSAAPDTVAGGLRFTALTAGMTHTCGIATDAKAYCWGIGYAGELGLGVRDSVPQGHFAPEPVAGGHAFQSISASSTVTCALTDSGAAYCWGRNDYGQLGIGSTDFAAHATPEPVAGGITFASIDAGPASVCGVDTGGAAWCWGANTNGNLGDGTTTQRTTPAAVTGGLMFSSVDVGVSHACGMTTGGLAYCWGDNGARQLGSGSAAASEPAPVRVAGQP